MNGKNDRQRKKQLGREIRDIRTSENTSISELVESMADSSFGARRVGTAAKIWKKSLEEMYTVWMSVAGAMTPAGMGGIICDAMSRGQVDVLSITDANLYHDLQKSLGIGFHQVNPDTIDDRKLAEEGKTRIYDAIFEESGLYEADKFLKYEIFPQMSRDLNRPVGSPDFFHELGKHLKAKVKNTENSILCKAYENDVPIFVPTTPDGSIALNRSFYNKHMNPENPLIIDADLDIEYAAALSRDENKLLVVLGGGVPKNFCLQAPVHADQIMGLPPAEYKRIVQISMDPPHTGGLSGATPSEAITWHKIKADDLEDNTIVVYSDTTIALPIIYSYVTVVERKQKRLYPKIPQYLTKMVKEIQGNAQTKKAYSKSKR